MEGKGKELMTSDIEDGLLSTAAYSSALSSLYLQ
jgi:hypothetical protein